MLLSGLLGPLFSNKSVEDICSDRSSIQYMLDFEAALARSEARLGVIPSDAADCIASACLAEHFDLNELRQSAPAAGNLAIPLVKHLTNNVAKRSKHAARFVHWGATSQDVIDTGLSLCLRRGIVILLDDIKRAIDGFSRLANEHRRTLMVGRTWLQHALPLPAGLKFAQYASGLQRSENRLRTALDDCLVLQFGGAVGTLAALGNDGLKVTELLALELGIPAPDCSWHTHRDRFSEVASTLAILSGTCGKIGRDILLLSQTEVAEVSEPSGNDRGGSSTLPHKRNAVYAASAIAASELAPNLAATIFAAQTQDHERSAGLWHSEWPTLPALLMVASGSLSSIVHVAEGLTVDARRMLENLNMTKGLVMSEHVSMILADSVGKARAHELVGEASKEAVQSGITFRDALLQSDEIVALLSSEMIDELLEPHNYLGCSDNIITRILISLSKAH